MERRGPFILLVLTMLIMTPMAGCINAQFLKTLIEGKEKSIEGWTDVTVADIYWEHSVDIAEILNSGPEAIEKEFRTVFNVKEGSTRITISYNLTMINPSDGVWQALEGWIEDQSDEAGQIIEFIRDLDRKLEIRLIDPLNDVRVDIRQNATTDGISQEFEYDLEPGEWALEVFSRGLGWTTPVEYHDSYTITTVVREPFFE